METLVFKGSKSILVNGSATKEFVVGKGLRQGDHLSPFLFIIVMEGLTMIMKKEVEMSFFKGFKVNEEVSYSVVQFANDTLFVGDGNRGNLWCIKALLRGFEKVSRLRVNFIKSSICGVNLKPKFLEATSVFLHCGINSLSFKCMGILVGDKLLSRGNSLSKT